MSQLWLCSDKRRVKSGRKAIDVIVTNNPVGRSAMSASVALWLTRFLLCLFSLVAECALSAGGRNFTNDDQVMIADWLSDTKLTAYSTSNNTSPDHDRWFCTHSVLLALHTTRPDHFYHYLSSRMGDSPGNTNFVQLLKPVVDLNSAQEQVLYTMMAQRNVPELADWLRHYIDLEKYIDRDSTFSSQLFALLTQSTLDATEHCPEVAALEHFKGTRERRQAILQCLVRSLDLAVLDIDISVNRVTTFRLLSPQPADLPLPPPAMLDNSENHFVMIPGIYNHETVQPIILLTTPVDSGFITTAGTKARHLITMSQVASKRAPGKGPLTGSERDAIRQVYGIPGKGKQSLSRPKSEALPWLKFWITSPGYSIVGAIVIGVGITLFVAYYPFPGNPFVLQ